MPAPAVQKNVPSILDYPQGSFVDGKDLQNPVGVNSFKRFGQIQREHSTRERLVQGGLY